MAKNKKKIITLIISLSVLLIIGAVILGIFLFRTESDKVKSSKDGDITRFEWMEMLCKKTGMTDYKNKEPYYKDVQDNSKYYPFIQSAVEWKILETSSEFDGESLASGRFIALTAMKSIGEEKIKIYADNDNKVSDNTYIRLAIDNNLIDEDQLSKGFSKEECQQILKAFDSIYFGVFWKDDYTNVKYKDNVIELPSDVILHSDDKGLEITVKQEAADRLNVNSIIVFEQSNTKLKIARKVNSIESGGVLKLSEAEVNEVIESMVASDITELTFDDIINYYGLTENDTAISNMSYQPTGQNNIRPVGFSKKIESKGFKISLSTSTNDEEENSTKKNMLEIKVASNDTGVAYQLPINYELEKDRKVNAEIDIDKINIGAQAEYNWLEGVKYAEVALDSHTTFTSKLENFKEEKKILLCKTPVPLGNGIIGVDIQFFLVLSVEGDISFKIELPAQTTVRYEKDKGLRNFEHEISAENPRVEANCEAGAKLRFEPALVLLNCLNVIDTEADLGVTASAKATIHPTQECADVSISFPVITISVCGDEDAHSVIGELGLSAEWEIITAENAPIKFGLHFEHLKNGKTQFVEKCTYTEEKPTEASSAEEATESTGAQTGEKKGNNHLNSYTTRYRDVKSVEYPKFTFDYPDNWTVTQEDVTSDRVIVTLTNSEGAEVTFSTYFYGKDFNFSYGASVFGRVEVTEADGSQFVPSTVQGTDHSDLGEFMVAKLHQTGVMYITNGDSDYRDIDGETEYAVIPKSEVGTKTELSGHYEGEFAFWYNAFVSFIGRDKDGDFTVQEQQEVISILNSFRLA